MQHGNIQKEFSQTLPLERPMRDVIWAILFLAQLIVVIILAITKLSNVNWDSISDGLGSNEMGKVWALLGIIAGVMFVFGWLWRIFMKIMAGRMIKFSIFVWAGLFFFKISN